MKRRDLPVWSFTCMLVMALSMQAQAMGFSAGNTQSGNDPQTTTNRPWGNLGAAKQAPKYQPPQPSPNNYYPGASPGYGAPMPGYGMTAPGEPLVEVLVEGSEYYEQQNVVLTVRVVSDVNLKSLDADLPRIDGAVLEHFDGPVATNRNTGAGGRQQIVNTYRYKLMLLRAGEIVIPPIRFDGTFVDNRPGAARQQQFSIAADQALKLDVRPASPAVRPWLPLHDLRLQANLLQTGPVKAGQPVVLELEVAATGMLGDQLPSLDRQLESADYRVYRDATVVQNGVSSDGRHLTGSRRETYTIIPLKDGWVRLPEVTLAWWDVDSHSARQAGLPFVHASPVAERIAAGSADAAQPLFPVYFWAPMVIVLSLIAGYWLGAWHRTRSLLQATTGWFRARGHQASIGLRQVAGRLSPLVPLRRARLGLALLMPKSVKLWMCTRCLGDEDDPRAWCAEFKSRVCRHLGLPSHAPLDRVTERLIKASPQAEPARLRALARSLDGAIYGGKSLDFPVWKQELLQQLRPGLHWQKSGRRKTGSTLPDLNPHSA